MTRQFITLSDKIFIEIFYLKYLYLQILFDKFSKDAFSVRLCVENWGGPWPPGPPGSVGPDIVTLSDLSTLLFHHELKIEFKRTIVG